MATNRLLASYVRTREAWHCPADRGLTSAILHIQPTSYEGVGASYGFNWYLQENYANQTPSPAEDPYYNLAGKKENWPPEPSRFIMMHEFATFPWDVGSTGNKVASAQWHYSAYPGKMFDPGNLNTDRDKLVAPILFVDGHCQQIDFTRTFQANPLLALGPGKDYLWYKPRN